MNPALQSLLRLLTRLYLTVKDYLFPPSPDVIECSDREIRTISASPQPDIADREPGLYAFSQILGQTDAEHRELVFAGIQNGRIVEHSEEFVSDGAIRTKIERRTMVATGTGAIVRSNEVILTCKQCGQFDSLMRRCKSCGVCVCPACWKILVTEGGEESYCGIHYRVAVGQVNLWAIEDKDRN